jgi:sec-independent protein translocase protein TatC
MLVQANQELVYNSSQITDVQIHEEKSLMDHLIDIRNFVFIGFGIWLILSLIAYFFVKPIQDFITKPASDLKLTIHFLSPMEGFFFGFKVAAISGFIASLPAQLFLLWKYVSSALKTKEKDMIKYFVVGSGFLTIFAIFYSWIGIIPTSLKFLNDFTPSGSQILLTSTEYFSFVSNMIIIMIGIFQIPTLVFCLIKGRIITPSQVKSKRREIYMVIIILTALFGSPDLFSWFLTSIPAIILFEGAVMISQIGLKSELMK